MLWALETSLRGVYPVHQIAMTAQWGSSPFCSVGDCFRKLNDVLRKLDIPAFTEFRDSSASSYQRLMSDVRETILLLSGDDPVNFFNTLIDEDVARDMRFGKALQSVASAYNTMTGGSRRPILIALKRDREDGLSRLALKRTGFSIQEDTYQRCDKDVSKDDVTGGRPSPGRALLPKIDRLLKASSSPINSAILSGRRAVSAPRRLDSTKRELYARFDDRDQITYRTFLRHCGDDFLSYSRATDCCEYCLEGREARKRLEQFRRVYQELDASVDELIEKYSDTPMHPIFETCSTISEVDDHREHKRRQRAIYHRQTNELRPHEITIECDWRRKGHLPLQEQECGSVWYKHTQYALFGVAVYWCDDEGITRHHSIDVLSQSITEDSHSSLEGLRSGIRDCCLP